MARLLAVSMASLAAAGGSMHLLDVKPIYGGWGIVAGQLPIAVGLGMGIVRQGKRTSTLSKLATAPWTLTWHESLNLAALCGVPVVFLVVNNVYGMGTESRASAEPELRAGRAHGNPPAG